MLDVVSCNGGQLSVGYLQGQERRLDDLLFSSLKSTGLINFFHNISLD